MRFQGRDRAERGRTGLVRRSRRSVRLVPLALSTGTSSVESLESRLLLSVFSGGRGSISFEPLPVNRSFVVPANNTAATLSVHATDSTLSPMATVSQPPNNPSGSWAGGDPGQTSGAIGPMLMLMKTVSQLDLATSGMLVVTTTRTGSLGEDSITPVIVMPPSNLLSPSSIPQSPWSPIDGSPGSPGSSLGGRSTTWAGDGPHESAGAVSSSTTSTTAMATLPDARNVQYDGTWTGPPGTTAFQLPVGPMTHEVGVSIRPGPNTGMANGPILAGLTLLDKDGDTLASIAPLWNPLTNSPVNAITVTLNGVPVGGTLVVQLASPPEGSVAGSATNSPGGMAVPYVMDVQRIDALANNGVGQGVTANSQPEFLGLNIGTLQWTTNQASLRTSSASSSSSEGVPLLTSPSFVTDPSLDSPIADESSNSPALDPAGQGGRIPLGPLASRSAAPMGPNLVSAWLDATPAVDRHERGVSQAIDDRPYDDLTGTGDDADPSAVGGVVLASAGGRARPPETPRSDGDADDAPIGLGPMPLRTANAAGSAPGTPDLDDLLAALAITTHHERPPASAPAGPDDPGPTLGLLGTTPHDADSRPAPDYLTTAFILALGMWLTTGPMLPDLMRLIPRRGGRGGWVPAGAARYFARDPARPRLFGDWRWRPVFLASRRAD